MINIDTMTKARLEEKVYPTIYTKNTLLKYYISKILTGFDISAIPINKINIIYIDDSSFSNIMGISFKSSYKNYKSKLILDEIDHFDNIFQDLQVEYNEKSINKFIDPFGMKFSENNGKIEIDKENLYYEFCKNFINTDNNTEINNNTAFKWLYDNMFKYIYYTFSNITDSINVDMDYFTDYFRVTSYYEILDAGKRRKLGQELQEIIDRVILEFIEFPFLMDLIDEITIYQPYSSENNMNFTIINDKGYINNKTKLINITDTYSAMYSYSFTENFKDYILYSNPNISCNLIVDSGSKNNISNRLSSASSKVIESLFIEQYLSNYSKIFCILDLTGRKSPQLKTDLPNSTDIVNLNNIDFIPLKIPIYNPEISQNDYEIEKDNEEKLTRNKIDDIGESNINKLEWDSISETAENDENKIYDKNSSFEINKNNENALILNSELDEKGWFFDTQNSIPNCKHDKKENQYKNLYKKVEFENFMGRMDNMILEYESLINYPEYDIIINENNFNPIDLYPDLKTFPKEYIHGLRKDINKDVLIEIFHNIIEISNNFQNKLDESEEYQTYKDRGFQEFFHIFEVDKDDFINRLDYNNFKEIENDLFLLSIGSPIQSKIFESYKELFYSANIYNGEAITINGNEIDGDLTIYMFNENKNNKMNDIVENIKKSSNRWCQLFIYLKENQDKFIEQNGYLNLEQIKNEVITEFLKII